MSAWYPVSAQLTVDIYPTEEFMVSQMLMGDSSTKIWNVQFQGAHASRGIFYSKNTVVPIEEGLIISTGSAITAPGPDKGPGFTTSNLRPGDKQLQDLTGITTYDATWISFEFEATHDLIRFNYVFASEEYPEYVGSTFNDLFGFFLTDLETGEVKNLAVIPNTNLPITVNNINHRLHENFYIPNPQNNETQIEFDGMTKPLIAYSEVIPGKKYKIRIVIADVGDDAFDSGVFLEGKSFKSEVKELFFKENTTYFEAFTNQNNPVLVDIPTSEEKSTTLSISDHVEQPKEKMEAHPIQTDSVIIYFGFDEFTASPNQLQQAYNTLKNINLQHYKIQIIGHTDQKGTQRYNQNLSEKRAQYIEDWFKNNFNLSPSQVAGRSFNQLAQTQMDSKARAENRRVVIIFSSKNS